jgi:tetratricopeptide (TPR) repeat protein
MAPRAVVDPNRNNSKRLLDAIIRPFILVATDITGGLGGLIAKPFQELFKRSPEADKFPAKVDLRRVLQWPLVILLAVFSALLRILLSPVELLTGLISGNRSSILWALSGLLLLLTAGGLTYSGVLSSSNNLDVLRNRAAAAFRAGDFELAANQYSELIDDSSTPLDRDKLNYAISLSRLGNVERFHEILNNLAPGPGKGTPGFAPAHETLAIGIATDLSDPNSLLLEVLKWHLECSGDSPQSAAINNAWAKYYLAVGDQQGALTHLKLAAEIHPEYLLMVAEIYRSQGNELSRKAALKDAAVIFEERLSAKSDELTIRTTYSNILFQLGQFKDAEQVLLEGQKLANKPELRTACAQLYLSQYQQIRNDSGATDESKLREQFKLLNGSLAQDINYLPTYKELMRAYGESRTDEERSFIVEMLRKTVAENGSVALAHLSLSNILWVQGKLEESRFHMENAFKLDSKFAFVCNNLAWMLAHGDPPELDRACELANQVVELNPNDGRFRDTLATILMKQKNHSQALAEFQKAIPTADDKKSIHRKMAEIYRALEKHELANQHQHKADAN